MNFFLGLISFLISKAHKKDPIDTKIQLAMRECFFFGQNFSLFSCF